MSDLYLLILEKRTQDKSKKVAKTINSGLKIISERSEK
jgi:hypothetical protein